MSKESALAVFENFKIRRVYDEKAETWFFSVVDIIAALLQQPDYQTARKYWNKLKERLKKEGSQTVTNCHQLKMVAEDGKSRLTRLAQVAQHPLPVLQQTGKNGECFRRGDLCKSRALKSEITVCFAWRN